MTRRVLTGVVAAVLSGAVSAPAQDVTSLSPPVLEAQGLLIAAYPELREGRITWRVDATAERVVVEARRATSPLDIAATSAAPALVSAAIAIDERGQLVTLEAGGTLLATARRKAAGAARQRDASDALKRGGAKYAPDSDASTLDSLVPAGLQRKLGTTAVRETEFRATSESLSEALTWRVEVESAETVPRRYTLAFEPVEGRLVSVVRR